MWKIIYFFFEEIHCYIMPRLPSKSEYDVEQFEEKKKIDSTGRAGPCSFDDGYYLLITVIIVQN